MTEFCHRCGGELPATAGSATFCPHCGAPQIYFSGQNPDAEQAGSPQAAAPPPPRLQLVEWKTAIRSALLIGITAAILNVASAGLPALTLLNYLLIFSAPALALAIYQKHHPRARMDLRIGARIGLAVGVVLLGCLAASSVVMGVVARFGLHNMADFDAQLLQKIHQGQEIAQNWAVAHNIPKPDYSYMNTPEARVWILLLNYMLLGGAVLVFSALAGALGGTRRTRRN
ncbi:MAG: zinc ribbon domain-containing protein [Acidobacteriaceae bacterium]|nr:zinc ribbon domain-containing protein [Acidobacteriaceae bacterium]